MLESNDLDELKRTLAELANRADREEPYAFAGRETERAHFRMRAERLPPYGGGAGGTTLITGAPGAGKTALMRQAVADFREAHPNAVEIKVPSKGEGGAHGGFRQFLRQAAYHLAGGADPASPSKTIVTSAEGKVGLPLVGASGKTGSTVDVLGNPATFQDVHDQAVRRSGGSAPRFGPTCCMLVTMDEAQALQPDGWPALLLSQAHLQDFLPIQVICAGLSDSEDALDEAGVSRPAAGHHLRLGPLSRKEASESVVRALSPLAALGLDVEEGGAVLAQCAARFAKESDGWPKHLHCYMKAMFSQLADMERPSLRQLDLAAAVKAGDSERRHYYDGRLRAGKTHEAIVLALHDEASRRKIRRSQTSRIIGTAVRALKQTDPDAAAEWADNHKGRTAACFKAMLHAGLVALDAEDVCFVPIPSLRAHVEALARLEENECPKGPVSAQGERGEPRQP